MFSVRFYVKIISGDKMKSLYDFNYEEMSELALEHGWKKFRGHQIFQWLYRKRVTSIDDMSDLSKDTREVLKENYQLKPLELRDKQVSSDGTCKYLFALEDGSLIESVLMQFDYGKSICVTSQVGCNMACAFCASGLTKKKRNLTSGEMVAQVLYVQQDLDKTQDRLSHIVVMGTGEPFDNYENVMNFLSTVNHDRGLGIGARHITISTCGVVPKIYEFSKEHTQYNLAVSLHAPNNELRNELMPINKAYPLEELMKAIHQYASENNRRLTFEYILLKGVNDQKVHVDQLAKLMKGLNAYVNLIPYNAVDENGFKGVKYEEAMVFYDALMKKGVRCTIRKEHGADIDAACGQLRVKHLRKEKEMER
jgi:23S rRNA (adenine2503-C2)-methyltransferase